MDAAELKSRAAAIQLLVLDVDGVLTDGSIQYDADGREMKTFHVRDGLGIKQAMRAGIVVAVISGRRSKPVRERLAELGVGHALLGREDKAAALAELLRDTGIDASAMAAVGDDTPDLPVLRAAGLGIAVADAHPEVAAAADWQTRLGGGRGAVREVCDLLVASRS